MSSTATTTLDEKREEVGATPIGGVEGEGGDGNGKTTKEKWVSFLKTYGGSLLLTITFAIFLVGSTGLYATKVAQANILPTNVAWSPFTNVERSVRHVAVDLHCVPVFATASGANLGSQKAQFSAEHYNLGFKDSFLCSLKSNAKPENGLLGTASLFFYNVFAQMTAKNAIIHQTVFGALSHLPEWAVMIVYGLFGWLFWIGIYFANFGMNLFYMLVNIPQLFRAAAEKNEKAWQPEDAISFRFLSFLLLCFLWFPIGIASAFLTPIWFSVYSLMLPLSANYVHSFVSGMSGSSESEGEGKGAGASASAESTQQGGGGGGAGHGGVGRGDTYTLHGFMDFVKGVFVYKKQLFIVLATLSLVYNAFSILDTPAAIGTCVAVLAMYFMGAYKTQWGGNSGALPSDFTRGWVNTMQNIPKARAGKVQTNEGVCPPIPVWEGKEEGWWDFLFGNGKQNKKEN